MHLLSEVHYTRTYGPLRGICIALATFHLHTEADHLKVLPGLTYWIPAPVCFPAVHVMSSTVMYSSYTQPVVLFSDLNFRLVYDTND